MAIKQEIIRIIDATVYCFHAWTIGITSDLEGSRKEHGYPEYWYKWEVESDADAEEILKHFLSKRMKAGCSENKPPATHVYLFLR